MAEDLALVSLDQVSRTAQALATVSCFLFPVSSCARMAARADSGHCADGCWKDLLAFKLPAPDS
jgi:hypothetical protein